MKKRFAMLGVLIALVLCASCGSSTVTTDNADDTEDEVGLTFNTEADFESSASAALSKLIAKVTTGTCEELGEDPEMDSPGLADGLDCDGDGGVVAHVTPSQYTLALKRVTMLAEDGDDIDLIEDSGTLAESEVINFTPEDHSETVIEIAPEDLVAGTYTGLRFEIYYFQLTFPVGGETKNVRFYMSDDDFDAEGNLGHHQGDVTLIGNDGAELGWINGTWDEVSDDRSVQSGASTADPETDHERGFFGNNDQWNATPQMQGDGQDIFAFDLPFDIPIPIPEPADITENTEITATFSVADTFFYEDFDNPTLDECTGFCPEEGGEAGLPNAEWAPLTPIAEVAYLPIPIP